MADAGDSESEDEVEYSGMIQPPLIHQLRNILEEYPDDGQILKELIQNAEDAGATEMKILFDDRPLLTTTTINEKKTPFRKYFKGPSLIVHNNALFTEDDWKGIKMLYSSIKEFDPMKVGRFGLGFKSIFHITDHPIIVSGSQLLILDPHKDLSRVCQTMKLQKLNKNRKMKEEDCKAAFDGIFGFDSETLSKGFYQGTLLRFPLRQDATALSSNIYDREKVMDLFHSFIDEASVTLLFLKSLEKIALYLNKGSTGEGKIEPSFHFMVGITEKSLPDVRSCRKEFMDKIKALKGRLPSTTLESKIKMEIHTEDDEGKSSDKSWLVVNSMKGGKVSPELKTLSADESLSYSPYVGVALPLVKDTSFQGHVFCFLPLPLEQKSLTGLPVHVNGFFALSQNRRHVKWPSADQIRHRTHKDKSIRWNTCMVQEALSSAYDSLVDHMISNSRSEGNPEHLVRLVLQSIPSPEAVSGHWEILLEPLYACLKKRTFLYTENRGGQWILTEDAIFVNSLSEGLPNPVVRDTVLQVLRQYKVDIVDVPNNVWEMVQSWSVNKITPAYVSRLLKSNSWYTKCETAEKDNLLRYLLLNRDFSLLQDLELLPLADGSYTSFKPRQAKCPVIYLCNEHERQMFPGLEERMVRQLPDDLRPYFAEMVQKNWFRICQPSRSDIISLLEEVIERNFETHATHRVWKKKNPVTKVWLKEVWEYLRNNLLKSLDEVEHLHIIPVETDGSIHLFSLTDLLINKTGKRSAIPDEVCRCLKAMSVVVITKLPQFITAHAQLPNYVCDADCEGVIEVLTKLGKNGNLSSSIDRFNSKCSRDEKDALVAMLSSSSSITCEARQILRQMQMFKGNDCDEMVSVLQRDEMITEDFVVKFCRPVMLCLETYQETLAEMLEVRGLSKEDIITDVLRCMNERGFYSKKEQQKIIKYIMENITVFEKNRGIVELLKQVKFVPDGNGVLKKPNELFDYRNKELCELLENPDDFPHQGKVPEKGLDILIKLGLKSEKNLTRHEIIKVANELEHKSSLNTVSEKDRRRATLLLTILSRNANLLENSTNGRCLCDELNNFHIIVPTEPSETYACVMPWFQPQTQLLCPKDMTAHKFISLIGSVQPVLPSDIPHTLVQGFRWDARPKADSVIKQLDILVENYNENYVDLSELNRQSQTCLNQTCQDIYAFIDAICEECKNDVMESSRISDTLQILKNKPCLLINDKFVKPEHVAIYCGTDCSPILYSLYNNNLRHQQHLLSHIGVKEKFQTRDIMKILLNLSSENNGEKLVGKDLKLYCNLIHLLAELITDTGGHIEGKHLRIPDTDCHLTLIQDLCVDDVEYVKKSKSMKFVHENISKRDAKSIGVKSANRGKLLDHALIFRPFGQKEALTNGIKRILSGYPCDEGILKELLQNADDSKATEIKFILDASNHQGDQKIFDSCWKPLQGPALLVFNNSCFSEEDIEGIQQLGIGSKGDDPMKTGQYGVGFNAVYHLTDVPSFLTKSDAENETLCVMDPMCKYVPDATKENPGMRYEDLPDLRNSFPDVFSRYFEDQLMENKGTIFRLPLRTEIFANQSDFSKKAVDENVVKQLLKKFEGEMFEMLVFVKNVKKITLSRVVSEKVIDDYSVELLISEEDEERRQAFVKTVKDIAEEMGRKRDLRQLPVEEVSYRVEIKDNRGKSQKLLVVQRIGFRDEAVPEVLLQAYREGQIGLLPYGGVAMPLEPKHVHDKCKAYCFLPLPIETGIPMHVNGHFALDHEARRNLWTEDKVGYRSEWNRLVLRSVISPAYICALQRLKDVLELNSSEEILENGVREKLKMFDKYFPCHKESRDANWKYLVESIFSDIMRREERLFMSYRSVGDGKCIVSFFPLEEEHAEFHSVFNTIQRQLPKQTYTQANSSQKDIKLMNVSKALGMKLLDTSFSVLESMKDAGIEAKAISPGYFIRFLKSFSSSDDCHCNQEGINDKLDRTPFGDLENVKIALEYCKMSEVFSEEVDGLPLCVTNDSKLKCFSEDSPVFMTKYCKFFPSSPGEFLHENLVEMFTGITTGCFKTFNVKALAEVLPFELQTEKYKVGNAPVQWNPKDKGIPNKSWLKSIWEFLREDTSSIKERDPTKKARLMASHLFELQRWCLIPGMIAETKYLIFVDEKRWLFQISRAKEVLYISDFEYKMQNALKILKLPILDEDILPASCPHLSLVARRDRPEDVLECLYLHRQEISENTNLTNDVCNTVLEWLNSNLEVVMKNTDNNQQCISYLRALPMYLTTFGSNTDLAENMRVLVLPSDMPPNGMKEWARQTRTMLLQQNSRLVNIYKVLKVQESTVNDVYMNHIFPHYVGLPKDSRLVHLKFVRDTLLRTFVHCESKLKLIEALKRLHFVEMPNGMMELASNFYSPVDKVFQAFLKDTSFAPEPFRSDEWHKFMKMAGLETELTAELFLKFAKQLENEGRQGCTDALREKSKLLVERMFQGGSHEYGSVLGKIATIKFIAPYQVKEWPTNIHRQYDAEQMICFKGSVPCSFKGIAYTSCDLLPNWANPNSHRPTSISTGDLQIEKCPSLDKVILHVQNICDSFSKLHETAIENVGLVKVAEFMENIYDYLQKYAMQNQVLKRLNSTPVLLIKEHKRFVSCTKAVIGLKEEIKPFLFKAPEEFGKYFSVFEKLGTTRETTCDTYAKVLELLHNDIVKKHRREEEMEMHANELLILKKALHAFFKTLPETTEKIKTAMSAPVLYLPSRQKRLVDATKLVYSDRRLYEEKIKHLEEIEYCLDLTKMEISDSWIKLRKLPDQYKPQFLSEMLQESVDSENLEPVNSEEFAILQKFVQSREFKDGVIRLIAHERRNDMSLSPLCKEEEKNIESGLQGIEIRQVEKLKVNISINGKVVGSSSKDCHYETNKTGDRKECIFYCTLNRKENFTKWLLSLEFIFKLIIEWCTGHYFKSDLFNKMFLSADDPHQIEDMLDENAVQPYEFKDRKRDNIFPTIGTPVHRKWHALLDNLDPEFDEDEYAALLISDVDDEKVFIYVMIEKRLDDSTSENDQIIVYTRQYRIKVDRTKTEVRKAYDLYKFTREPQVASMELVVMDSSSQTEYGASADYRPQPTADFDQRPLKDIFKELRELVKSAWRLPEDEKKKVLKRLLRKWHPDKNHVYEQKATEVFKYLQNIIKKKENGVDIDEDEDESNGQTPKWKPETRTWYDDLFDDINRGCRRDRQSYEEYWYRHSPMSSSRGRQNKRHKSYTRYEPYEPNPQPGLARQWFRQARSDLAFAEEALVAASKVAGFNWICFCCYQATENALIALQYNTDDAKKISRNESIYGISISTGNTKLQTLARSLESLTGGSKEMRHPDLHRIPKTPSDLYSQATAEEAIRITKELLDIVRDLLY